MSLAAASGTATTNATPRRPAAMRTGQTAHHGSKHGCGVALLVAIALMLYGCATTSRPPPPTLEELVQLSADGLPEDEIIAQLRKSRAVYPLTATEILALSEKGVPSSVLDYMQQAYIANERRRERMMYGDPFWAYPCIGCPYPYYRTTPFFIYHY